MTPENQALLRASVFLHDAQENAIVAYWEKSAHGKDFHRQAIIAGIKKAADVLGLTVIEPEVIIKSKGDYASERERHIMEYGEPLPITSEPGFDNRAAPADYDIEEGR